VVSMGADAEIGTIGRRADSSRQASVAACLNAEPQSTGSDGQGDASPLRTDWLNPARIRHIINPFARAAAPAPHPSSQFPAAAEAQLGGNHECMHIPLIRPRLPVRRGAMPHAPRCPGLAPRPFRWLATVAGFSWSLNAARLTTGGPSGVAVHESRGTSVVGKHRAAK
jgi:hypothetical protein